MSWITFITQDVNNSISNKNKHYNQEQIIEIFKKDIEKLNFDDLYALKIIFTESFLQAFVSFLKETNVNLVDVIKKYKFLKEKKGIKNEKLDWFFGI